MKLHGKTIVVTGGANGIGRELVLALLKSGNKVAAVDISMEALNETRNLAGDAASGLSLHTVNLADKAAVEKLPEEVIAAHGSVDAIINNAGIIQPFVRINDLSYDVVERVMNVNFYGTLYMIKAFLPHLLKRPEAQIVNVTSMGGFLPVPGQGVYGGSKAAVKLMTEALIGELSGTNVTAILVMPGAIATNITSNSGVEVPQMENGKKSSIKPLPAPKAADIIIKAMEKNKTRVFVGSDARTMDILYRINPNFAIRFITKQMKSLLK